MRLLDEKWKATGHQHRVRSYGPCLPSRCQIYPCKCAVAWQEAQWPNQKAQGSCHRGSAVVRAGSPYTEAIVLVQRLQVQLPAHTTPCCVSPLFSLPCFLSLSHWWMKATSATKIFLTFFLIKHRAEGHPWWLPQQKLKDLDQGWAKLVLEGQCPAGRVGYRFNLKDSDSDSDSLFRFRFLTILVFRFF